MSKKLDVAYASYYRTHFYNPFQTTKEYLKLCASIIKLAKQSRKNMAYGQLPHQIKTLQMSYRLHHIALCELKGRKREEIEKPGPNNQLDIVEEAKISQIKARILGNWIGFQRAQKITVPESLDEEREKYYEEYRKSWWGEINQSTWKRQKFCSY